MFWNARAFNQPLSIFNTSAVTSVSVHLCRVRLDETPNFDSYPPCFQMDFMFAGAEAFNQPLLTFNTAAVTSVSAYLCRVRLEDAKF